VVGNELEARMPNEVSGAEPAASRRPALHFVPERGWINDPHGVTFRAGRYHLFHQAVPDSTQWEPGISWGHATSPDLLTWQQQPPVLLPGDGDDGCWSGSVCTTPADARPAMYYTSVRASKIDHGTVRVARPVDDGWLAWRKGPVVVRTPEQPPVGIFRDPNVFWDGDCWRMLVGAGYPDGRPAVLCYRSTDQEQWTAEGPLVEGERPESCGYMAWECPQLVRVGNRHILLVSVLADGVGRDVLVAVGSYRAGGMDIDHWSQLTHGPGHYAPTTFLDADGQPCVIFWIRGIGDADAGWYGTLSVPYRLSIVDGHLAMTPHPVLATARPDPRRTIGFTWRPGAEQGERLSLDSDDGRPALDLVREGNTLTITTPDLIVRAPLEGDEVDVLVDGCVLEVGTARGLVGLPQFALPHLGTIPPDITPWWG
jgi:beta-fructofuranosidase